MSAAATSPYRCNARPTWVVHYRQRLEPVIRRLGRRKYLVGYNYGARQLSFDTEEEAAVFKRALNSATEDRYDACVRIEIVVR